MQRIFALNHCKRTPRNSRGSFDSKGMSGYIMPKESLSYCKPHGGLSNSNSVKVLNCQLPEWVGKIKEQEPFATEEKPPRRAIKMKKVKVPPIPAHLQTVEGLKRSLSQQRIKIFDYNVLSTVSRNTP